MRVGYLLIEKKAHALGLLDKVKEKLEKNNIKVIKINDKKSLIEQGPFNIIIHKLSDYQREAENGNKIAINIIEQMKEYEKNNKETCIFIDSIEMVFQLANRSDMSKICEKASFNKNGYKVYVPSWIQIDSINQLNNIEEKLKLNNVTYPILCKSLNAAEGEGAHDMQLIFDKNQLINYLKIIPCIAQKFINHDMKMCKIFVVGKSWCIVNRPSIRNFKNYKECKSINSLNLKYENTKDIKKSTLLNNLSQYNNISQYNLSQYNLSQNNLSQNNLSQNNLSQYNLSQNNLSQNNLSQNNLSQNNLSQNNNNFDKSNNLCKLIDKIDINESLTKNINYTKCINETIIFNSHTVSKPDSSSYLNKYAKKYHQHVSYGNNELLNDEIVNEIIKRLQLIIPFTLMGIDIIVHDNNYGLIDINFLPGYDGMINFYDEFYNLLISKLKSLSIYEKLKKN